MDEIMRMENGMKAFAPPTKQQSIEDALATVFAVLTMVPNVNRIDPIGKDAKCCKIK